MLRIENLCFTATGENGTKDIIKDLNLVLEDKTFAVITGPNGGGKTTLAKLIMGLEKPTSGKIYWNEQDITDLSVTERAKLGVSYGFQQPPRFKGVTVYDLLKAASGRDMTRLECCEYLTQVGLCARDYINREVNGSLSGGELKRIEIATVLARDTVLSVFDEPEAGIDLWSFKSLIEVFERMRSANSDRTIIVISHQERILNIADEIIVLGGGNILAHGPREEVLPTLLGTSSAVSACGQLTKGGEK